ncbi:phospholipase D-like domain-containing protein [Paenibacillus sp. R14(2021)]|uniref:phospholipase D-like domain-containing protein n=1 Tax=Paenibacillus sp. R14(2021) TaxID=2859228 RepID=UPI00215728B2|nr:phospholipase D-like domain-containing protein [Paenibacillus sp. R14(2021)]
MKFIRYVLPAALALFVAGCSTHTSTTASTSKVDNSEVEWAFTQAEQQPDQLLIGVIDGAADTLDIAIYSLTKPDIVDAIKQAKKRGVSVRIITDRIQARGKSQKEALKLLGSAGVPLKINKHSGLMHLKITIADGKTATTGSFNYSKAASTDNDEVLMLLHNSDIAASFEKQFQAMWDDTAAFEAITPIIAEDAVEVNAANEGDKAAPEEGADLPDASVKSSTSGASGSKVIYRSCAEAKAAGKAPLRKGDPGYNAKMDGDGDGIACER